MGQRLIGDNVQAFGGGDIYLFVIHKNIVDLVADQAVGDSKALDVRKIPFASSKLQPSQSLIGSYPQYLAFQEELFAGVVRQAILARDLFEHPAIFKKKQAVAISSEHQVVIGRFQDIGYAGGQ